MAAETTTQAQVVVPAGADGTVVSYTGTWTKGSWVQLIASTSSAITICAVSVQPGIFSEVEIDIGKGAAGSEVVVGTLRGVTDPNANGSTILYFPIVISNIATSTRVAARVAGDQASDNFNIALTYYATAAPSGITTTAKSSNITPASAAPLSITPSGTAWVSSSWVQLIASTASAIVVTALSFNTNSIVQMEVDVGTGAAGAEVVVTTIRMGVVDFNNPGQQLWGTAFDNIAASTRVALRSRQNDASIAANNFTLQTYNKPL